MRRSRVIAAVGAVSAAAVSAASIAVPTTAQARTSLDRLQRVDGHLHAAAVAWPTRAVDLHAAPGSRRVVARVERRTRFGTPTALAVSRVEGRWAEVMSSTLPNRTHAYVRLADVVLTYDPVTLELDLSRHQLLAWRGNELLRAIPVATGSPVSPTPLGRYAVTDKLTNFDAFAYGCCVLALSGHQERLAPGWHGGDRLAIHSGGGIGESISSGCIHARESDLHWLLRRVPLGTQITIHP